MTPHDVGTSDGVVVVGGTLATDDTTGTQMALGAILTDWNIALTNGTSQLVLNPSNSSINDAAIFDVTATDITFVDMLQAGRF